VSKESATLDYAGREELPRPTDANHTNCARFSSANQHQFIEIASKLANITHTAIDDLQRRFANMQLDNGGVNPPQGAGWSSPYSITGGPLTTEPRERRVEPVYFQLTRYTTIFLVDDSSSIEDMPEFGISAWSDTTHALTECTSLILGSRGRLKVHFFNSARSKENISGVTELQELCRFRPRGDTPTYQCLKRHLDEFMEAFEPLNAS